MSRRTGQIPEESQQPLPEQGNCLLLAPSIGGSERSNCLELLSKHNFETTKLIHVLYRESATDRHEMVERHFHEHPDESAVITVESSDPSGMGSSNTPSDYYVESLTDAGDLTGLGIALNDCLSEWHAEGIELGLCFDSLSVLLQYADFERVFKFLHTLTGKLADVTATAHFHLDPVAHNDREVAQLRQVFDSVVEVDEDGTRTVSR